MEDEVFVDDCAVDFEIEEDLYIDRTLLEKYNEFESCEIEIPDDIVVEDILNLEENEQLLLEEIPTILFIDDDNIELVTTGTVSLNLLQPLICDKCGKSYKKKNFFEKHVALCGR